MSDISYYEYSVGTTYSGSDILGWTFTNDKHDSIISHSKMDLNILLVSELMTLPLMSLIVSVQMVLLLTSICQLLVLLAMD